jgi:hypothetical protein
MLAYPFTVTSERSELGLLRLDHAWSHRPTESGVLQYHPKESGTVASGRTAQTKEVAVS